MKDSSRPHLSFAAIILICLVPGSVFANVCASVFSPSPFVSESIPFRESYVNPKTLRRSDPAAQKLRYIRVNLPAKEGRLTEQELFRDPSDLIIGIDTTGATGGHMYVAVNGVRFDGRLFYTSSTKLPGWRIPDGLIIRYRYFPEHARQKIIQWMSTDQTIHALTCVAATCQLLFGRGAIDGPAKPYVLPEGLLRHLVEKMPISEEGSPIPFEIYTVNRDLDSVLAGLPSWRTVPKAILRVLVDPRTWRRSGRE